MNNKYAEWGGTAALLTRLRTVPHLSAYAELIEDTHHLMAVLSVMPEGRLAVLLSLRGGFLIENVAGALAKCLQLVAVLHSHMLSSQRDYTPEAAAILMLLCNMLNAFTQGVAAAPPDKCPGMKLKFAALIAKSGLLPLLAAECEALCLEHQSHQSPSIEASAVACPLMSAGFSLLRIWPGKALLGKTLVVAVLPLLKVAVMWSKPSAVVAPGAVATEAAATHTSAASANNPSGASSSNIDHAGSNADTVGDSGKPNHPALDSSNCNSTQWLIEQGSGSVCSVAHSLMAHIAVRLRADVPADCRMGQLQYPCPRQLIAAPEFLQALLLLTATLAGEHYAAKQQHDVKPYHAALLADLGFCNAAKSGAWIGDKVLATTLCVETLLRVLQHHRQQQQKHQVPLSDKQIILLHHMLTELVVLQRDSILVLKCLQIISTIPPAAASPTLAPGNSSSPAGTAAAVANASSPKTPETAAAAAVLHQAIIAQLAPAVLDVINTVGTGNLCTVRPAMWMRLVKAGQDSGDASIVRPLAVTQLTTWLWKTLLCTVNEGWYGVGYPGLASMISKSPLSTLSTLEALIRIHTPPATTPVKAVPAAAVCVPPQAAAATVYPDSGSAQGHQTALQGREGAPEEGHMLHAKAVHFTSTLLQNLIKPLVTTASSKAARSILYKWQFLSCLATCMKQLGHFVSNSQQLVGKELLKDLSSLVAASARVTYQLCALKDPTTGGGGSSSSHSQPTSQSAQHSSATTAEQSAPYLAMIGRGLYHIGTLLLAATPPTSGSGSASAPAAGQDDVAGFAAGGPIYRSNIEGPTVEVDTFVHHFSVVISEIHTVELIRWLIGQERYLHLAATGGTEDAIVSSTTGGEAAAAHAAAVQLGMPFAGDLAVAARNLLLACREFREAHSFTGRMAVPQYKAVAELLVCEQAANNGVNTSTSRAIQPAPLQLTQLVAGIGKCMVDLSLAVCAAMPVSHCCNNPMCSSLHGTSEALLVHGKGRVCGVCEAARYCGRKCQKAHWKQHKPMCLHMHKKQGSA